MTKTEQITRRKVVALNRPPSGWRLWQLRLGCLVPIVATICGICFARNNGQVILAVAASIGFLACFAWGVARYGTVTVELQSVEREIVVLKTWEEQGARNTEIDEPTGATTWFASGERDEESMGSGMAKTVYYVKTQLGTFRIPKTWYRSLLIGHTYVARLRTVNGKPAKLEWNQPLRRVSTGLTVRCQSCEYDFIFVEAQAGLVGNCPNCDTEMNFPFVESRAGQLVRREMAKRHLGIDPHNER